ncbi:MAG: hypothetical protein JRJ39_01570 [Deltaproteobacteria bacterium]|nr:hypothetical protein [Deltaproteobacteria bacterium]
MISLWILILLVYGLAVGLSLILKMLQKPGGYYTRSEWLWISLLFPIMGPIAMLTLAPNRYSSSNIAHHKQKTISWLYYKEKFTEYLMSMPLIKDIVEMPASQSNPDILSMLKAIACGNVCYLDFSLHYLICDQLVNLIENDVLTNKLLCQRLSQQDKDEISTLYCYCLNLETEIDFQRGTIQFITKRS